MLEYLDKFIFYFIYLRVYFDVINNFVKWVSFYIENDVYNILINYMEYFFMGFKELDKI